MCSNTRTLASTLPKQERPTLSLLLSPSFSFCSGTQNSPFSASWVLNVQNVHYYTHPFKCFSWMLYFTLLDYFINRSSFWGTNTLSLPFKLLNIYYYMSNAWKYWTFLLLTEILQVQNILTFTLFFLCTDNF